MDKSCNLQDTEKILFIGIYLSYNFEILFKKVVFILIKFFNFHSLHKILS